MFLRTGCEMVMGLCFLEIVWYWVDRQKLRPFLIRCAHAWLVNGIVRCKVKYGQGTVKLAMVSQAPAAYFCLASSGCDCPLWQVLHVMAKVESPIIGWGSSKYFSFIPTVIRIMARAICFSGFSSLA